MAADLARLRTLSADPALVPQVYDYCDQWCEYCGLTDRCLALRWVQARGGGELADLYRDLAAAARASDNGLHASLNPAIMAALAAAGTHFGDPLEGLAREYAARTHMFLRSLDQEPPATADDESRPPGARAVVARYHLLLAAKIFRAVAAAAIDPAASSSATSDATGTAKAALLVAGRSRLALADMAPAARDSRPADLIALLQRIEAELVRRFPLAPSFERPGFDAPRVSAAERRRPAMSPSLVSIYRETA
ncbi:MAG: hypothetical protein A3G21_01675 [Acidobacteria bacterium RIFCSPLOWO2_12_FULL_66_21]|nr:MAG: hypothetical protein A3G21_01675 [Acidobacteria bacterium RIFCSPLOWO2_12_FULL_66_21]